MVQPFMQSEAMDTVGNGIVLWSPAETARVLDVSENTLADWRNKKIGPNYLRIGQRLIRYAAPDVREYVEDCRVTNT
jgi:hypothetical protein